MAERFLFFNSTTGDARKYQAQDFAEYFGSVLSSGLLHTDKAPGMSVAVEPSTLNTVVSVGKAIMKGHLYELTAPLTLAHDLPETSLDRIDRVVLRLNLNNAVRDIKLHVIAGAPSGVPVAPELTRNDFIYEVSLAQVLVRQNTVQLLPSDLVDERLDESLCGLVHSLISIPTNQLQAFITAKRIELDGEMNTALDAYLLSLANAEQQLAADLVQWEQDWNDWFGQQQAGAFILGSEKGAVGGVALQDDMTTVQETVTTHLADDTAHVRYGSATSTNAKVIALNPAPTSLVDGFALSFKNVTQNSAAVTLNVNGLGAKPVLKANGTALASGNLKADSIYTVRFNGTSFILQGEGGSGNAVASNLLSGKTASTDAGDITGTMPDNGVFNLGLGVPVPAGYYSGGTTAGGKKWASGTGTASAGILTISVLSFRPSYIQVSYGDSSLYFTATYSSFHGYPFNNYGFRIGSYSGNNQILTDVSWTPSNSGFTYSQGYASSYGSIRWIAYE